MRVVAINIVYIFHERTVLSHNIPHIYVARASRYSRIEICIRFYDFLAAAPAPRRRLNQIYIYTYMYYMRLLWGGVSTPRER